MIPQQATAPPVQDNPVDRPTLRLAALLLLGGGAGYAVATPFHPGGGPDPLAELAGYAGVGSWATVHLVQFLCGVATAFGIVALVRGLRVDAGVPGLLGRFAAAAAVAAIALGGVLYAVDGVALKQAVEAWVGAPPAYPVVRAADASVAPLLDEMSADHAAIDPAVAALRGATARWAASGTGRAELVAAIVALEDVLLPHLDREVDEAMPAVSRAITHRQWHAWDQQYNIRPKSLPRLAEEGLWLMDGLDARRRAVVEAEVPWPVRMVVVHGFGPGYRRRSAARWAGTPVDVAS